MVCYLPRKRQPGDRGCWEVAQKDGLTTVWITCTGGHMAPLASLYGVGGTGRVDPRYLCPEKACFFGDDLTLVGWGN